LNPIQTIFPESDTNTSTSSQPQTSNKPSDESVIEHMYDHYKGELPSYVASPDKAFEIAYNEITFESPQQQQQPELRLELPNHIQLETQIPNQSISDVDTLVSKDQTLVEPPIIVALPAFVSEATIVLVY